MHEQIGAFDPGGKLAGRCFAGPLGAVISVRCSREICDAKRVAIGLASEQVLYSCAIRSRRAAKNPRERHRLIARA
jgi:hypothetical protein